MTAGRPPALALALALLSTIAGCVSPIVAPLRYEPVAPAPEEPFRAVPPDASPVPPRVPLLLRMTTLPNGLRVVLVERHGLPIISVRIVVARGSADTGAPGDTYAILERILQGGGTAQRSAAELSAAYAHLGAPHRVACGYDGVFVATVVGAEDLDQAVGLLAETATGPRLAGRDVADARRSWLHDFTVGANGAGSILSRNVDAALHGSLHPYGFARPQAPHTERVQPGDLAALHAQLFHPAQATLVVVGDATPAAVDAAAARWLGGWAPPSPSLERPPVPASIPGPRLVLVERRGSSQVHAAVAARGPAATGDDLAAVEVLARVFGGFSSRLRGEVRVESGAAYSFGAGLQRQRGSSTLTVSGALDAGKAVPALRTILDAIAEARTRGVREADFERARTTLLAEWRTRVSTSDGLASLVGEAIAHGASLEAFATYPDRIQAVTREDVGRAAQRYLGEEALHVVVVGPGDLRRSLEGLGLGAPVRHDLWAAPARP